MISLPLSAVRRLAPRAHPIYLAAFERADVVLSKYGVNATPLRLAHFLTQVLHETGGLTVTRESMKYRAARITEIFGPKRSSARISPEEAAKLAGDEKGLAMRAYGSESPLGVKLGNKTPEDGWTLRGTGLLQITGRSCWSRISKRLGVDLVADPDLALDPRYVLEIAAIYWTSESATGKNLNDVADTGDIVAVSKGVNGGTNGLADRKATFAKVWKEVARLSDDAPSDPDEAWTIAQPSPEVRWFQRSLNTLGATLKVDGKIGPKTTEAIKAFQRANRLVPDGIAGPVTRAAIQMRLDTLGKAEPEQPAKSMEASTTGWAARGAAAAALIGTYNAVADEAKKAAEGAPGLIDAALSIAERLSSSPVVWAGAVAVGFTVFIWLRRKHDLKLKGW